MDSLTQLGFRAYLCAIRRGKVDFTQPTEKRLKRQKLAIFDEVEELVAAKREASPHIPAYTADAEEAADVIISALTYLALTGVDIDGLIEEKMKYNETRER